ncbi:Zinc uptake regulation protein [Sinobacterium norvegicum]|uniref:Zinc uptake regulation protein n=1 Tax=Sinobacterium norvegicum TaxID=1641715 RepID=A0ABM9AGV0_9GAMM|nr:transcriptional repressor [Sinobacterium norvegicum]CAH0992374.1 Zinc uptake regulation protein [Sinobacterium norvegicum]
MNNLQAIISHAENSCKAHGSRLTPKRKQILSGLLQSDRAMSAYELVDYCKGEYGESPPPMSVYRILDFLQSEHLVHKLNLANKYIACAHITCDHDHGVPQFLICGRCQRVEEITVGKATIDSLKHNVEDAGFYLASPQLEMDCLCKACHDNPA